MTAGSFQNQIHRGGAKIAKDDFSQLSAPFLLPSFLTAREKPDSSALFAPLWCELYLDKNESSPFLAFCT
jgi:hypothetical protein